MASGPVSGARLEVRELTVEFDRAAAVDGVSFVLERGETLGVVGESGCGKTLTGLALMGLCPPGAAVSGSIRFRDQELVGLDEASLRGLRGRRIATVFQDPLTSLNPVLTVGDQVAEMFVLHEGASRSEAADRAVAALERVRIADPERRAQEYPHQLSGGMCQRVMIAIALACGPDLLIADEATTALDVTVQAQILDLIRERQEDSGMSVLFISHNLAVIAALADRIMVMYRGRAVELAPADDLLSRPHHPYTRALLETLPRLDRRRPELPTIPGVVPSLAAPVPGCAFFNRCALASGECEVRPPPSFPTGRGRLTACYRVERGN